MFTFVFATSARIIQAIPSPRSTSLPDTFIGLASNPMARAKPTNLPIIGNYYVNSGRYCILFDVDEANRRVIVYGIVASSYLHKVLTGRIQVVDGNK